MARYFTKLKDDVLDAVAEGRRVEWRVTYDDDMGLWYLAVVFWSGEDEIEYIGRGFRASSQQEAEKKAKAQYVRMTEGKYISRPVLSSEFRSALAALRKKVRVILDSKKEGEVVLESFRVDWNAKALKIKPTGRGNPKDILPRYEPEWTAFIDIFKREIK